MQSWQRGFFVCSCSRLAAAAVVAASSGKVVAVAAAASSSAASVRGVAVAVAVALAVGSQRLHRASLTATGRVHLWHRGFFVLACSWRCASLTFAVLAAWFGAHHDMAPAPIVVVVVLLLPNMMFGV